ncbi:MAG: protein phosphatase 2C domain-containing protein [Oscillospiraceae bacterium]|nr:protein phosphatase 2C domain-containing protein [Oscillospiraceae bacterium]
MGLFRRKNRNRREVTQAPEWQQSEGLCYLLANLQGIGTRELQEDSFTTCNSLDPALYREKGLLFAVCDGMGGMRGGGLASNTAVEYFRMAFNALDLNGDIPDQLEQSVVNASEAIKAQLEGEGGSTAALGIIYRDQLYFASVGDSFLYLMRNGCLLRLNREQNICHERYLECIRSHIFEPEVCRDDPEAAMLSQYLGMHGITDIDRNVRPYPLERGDVLLACTDGVGGVLTEDEIAAVLSQSSPQQMCRDLEGMIFAHADPHQDNYTALVVICV